MYASAPRPTRRARAGLSALLLSRSAMLLVLLLVLVIGSAQIVQALSSPFPLSGLDGSNGFAITGIDIYDNAGVSVSGAGDVNNDGIDDLIIGASDADPDGKRGAGESYVVFGGSSFGRSLNLSSLNGNNGFVINGIAESDHSGVSVSGAGDVNNDGIDDLIIGAYNADLTGESYVVFGDNGVGSSGSLNLSSLNGSNGFVINGIAESDRVGWSVSGAGDVNKDGYADVIIGAPFAAPNGNIGSGQSYVVFGGRNFGSSLNLSSLNGSNGFVLNGIDAFDRSGWSVSGAGDVNGDGYADVIIGAQYASPNGISEAGESYVVFGGSSFGRSLDLDSLDGSNGFVINGIADEDKSGASVSGAGDVNNDGIDDLIIGAYNADPDGKRRAGESYVVFGHGGSFGSSLNPSSLDGSNGFIITGIDAGDVSGISVSGAGDVNNDGIDDLIIGAPHADPNGSLSGESYVVFGHGGSFGRSLDLASLDGNSGSVINGIAENDVSGTSVSSAGDVNNDGIDDLFIGANYGNNNTGESYVVFGELDTIPPTVIIDPPNPTLTQSGPVDFSISIVGASTIALDASDVTLTSGDGVSGDISVSNGSTPNPTVTVNNLSGDGIFTIDIAAAVAVDASGNKSIATSSTNALVDNTAPTVSIGSPSATLTQSGPVNFPITIVGASTIALDASDVTLTSGDGVSGDISVSNGSTPNPTVTVNNLSGDGTFTIDITAEAAADLAGNLSAAAGPSNPVTVDNTAPTVSIGSPSATLTQSGPITFPVTIAGASTIALDAADVSLTTTGSVTGTVSMSGGTTDTPIVTVDSLSGDGTFTIDITAEVATDAAGNLTAAVGPSASVTVDNTAPAVSITAAPDDPSGSIAATVSFTATDSSGIASLECQLDGGAFEPCSSPVSYTGLGDGKHTVTVQATDNAGNSASASHTWTIDTALPAVSITAAPDDPSGSTEASISFTATDSDGIATLECQLDGGAFEPCSSPVSYTGLGDGEHTVTVRATDNVGNTGSASHTWTVDTALPAVSITAAPDDPSGSTEASISFTADDGTGSGIAGYECQIDGGAWEPCSSPVSYTGLSDGEHTVTVRATDNAGNTGTASHTWTIDSTLPVVSITAAPDDLSGNTEASISFTASDSDGIASLECQLDGGAWEPCSSPVSYTGLSDGEHTVTVRATDNVGNSASASHTWTVDTALPVVSITAAPDDPSGSTEASISFTASDSDGIASLECQLDGGAWEPCSSPVSYTGLSDGEHTVTVRVTDNVGNSASASHTWTVDSIPPAAAAPRLYLPLVMRSSAAQPADASPDLVGSVAIAPDQRSFAAGEPVSITIEVTNQGDAATEKGFWIDLYVNPSATPTVNQSWLDLCGLTPCRGIVWSVNEVLEPGETITLTASEASYETDYTRWPGWLASGTTDVYVVVDSWNCDSETGQCVAGGAVDESDEDNNLTHLGGLEVTGENPASLLGAPVVAPRTAMP